MKILKKSLPLVLAACLYGCPYGEVIDPVDSGRGGSAGSAGNCLAEECSAEGGNKVIDDCIENNHGHQIKGSKVEHYLIEGDDIGEVIANLADPSDGTNEGIISASSNECYLSIDLVQAQSETYLMIDDHPVYCTDVWINIAKVSPNSTTYLPKWSGCDSCWDSYLETLAAHEQGHADICAGSAKELGESILRLTANECWDWNPEISKYFAFQQLEYDIGMQLLLVMSWHQDKTSKYETETHQKAQESVLGCWK